MQISCVLDAAQLGTADGAPELIVFPEGVSETEIDNARALCPHSMIVAAVVEDGRSRGVLLHQGRNQIDYLEVTTDGRTVGSGNLQQMPLYEHNNGCIGVLICMDVNHRAFSRAVVERVRASECRLKLICIPSRYGFVLVYWRYRSIAASRRQRDLV